MGRSALASSGVIPYACCVPDAGVHRAPRWTTWVQLTITETAICEVCAAHVMRIAQGNRARELRTKGDHEA